MVPAEMTVERLQEIETAERNGASEDELARLAQGPLVEGDEEGQSIEDMAEGFDMEGEEEDETPYITGTTGQLSLKVGGRKPDSASFKAGAKEVKLADRTQFDKGSTVVLDVVARVDEVKFRDKHDNAGEVTHTTRVHIATPISIQRLSPVERFEGAAMGLLDTDVSRDEIRAALEQVFAAADAEG